MNSHIEEDNLNFLYNQSEELDAEFSSLSELRTKIYKELIEIEGLGELTSSYGVSLEEDYQSFFASIEPQDSDKKSNIKDSQVSSEMKKEEKESGEEKVEVSCFTHVDKLKKKGMKVDICIENFSLP